MQKKESSLPHKSYTYSFVEDEFSSFEEDNINLDDDYKYNIVKFGFYSFATDKGALYDIIFKPSFYIFGEEVIFSQYVYELVIAATYLPDFKIAPDPKIAVTIAGIFKHFFVQSDKHVCIYICDSSDGKQLVRQRKFAQWFEYFSINTSFVQLKDKIVDADGTIYPVSLITKRENPFLAELIKALDGLVTTYTKD